MDLLKPLRPLFKMIKALEVTPPDYGEPPYADLEKWKEIIEGLRSMAPHDIITIRVGEARYLLMQSVVHEAVEWRRCNAIHGIGKLVEAVDRYSKSKGD